MSKILILTLLALTVSQLDCQTFIDTKTWQTAPGVVIAPKDDYLSRDVLLGGSTDNTFVVATSSLLLEHISFRLYDKNSTNVTYTYFDIIGGRTEEIPRQSITTQTGFWAYVNVSTNANNTVDLVVHSRKLNLTTTLGNVTTVATNSSKTVTVLALWEQSNYAGVAYVIDNTLLYAASVALDKELYKVTLLADLTSLFADSKITKPVFDKVVCGKSYKGGLSVVGNVRCSYTVKSTVNSEIITGLYSTEFYLYSTLRGTSEQNLTDVLTNATGTTNVTDLRQVWSDKTPYIVLTTVNGSGFTQVTALSINQNTTTVLNNETNAKNLSVYSTEPYYDGIVVFYKYPESNSTVYATYHVKEANPERPLIKENETTILKSDTIFKTFLNEKWEIHALFDNNTESGDLDSIYVGKLFNSVDSASLKIILNFVASFIVIVLLF